MTRYCRNWSVQIYVKVLIKIVFMCVDICAACATSA